MIITVIVVLLGFFVAWNLGANDVANSMGTVVGSKALTLKKALILAGILELLGAVLFGQEVTKTLGLEIIQFDSNPDPSTIIKQMAAVLISCGAWLQVATLWGWPVASSHAVVGAIAGVTIGAINWGTLGNISLAWVLTPLASGLLASLIYRAIATVMEQYLAKVRLLLMGLSFGVAAIFLTILAPRLFHGSLSYTFGAGCLATMAMVAMIDRSLAAHDTITLESTESNFAQLQIVSACFVAFAHGSNDVGNAIAPLAVIINATHLDQFTIPFWVLLLGGLGIVAGLAVQGKRVIATVGEKIMAIKPSQGFAAEISTAAVILAASRLGFPVSTSHALVGAVTGIGLTQTKPDLNLSTLKGVLAAWAITLPIGFVGANLIYRLLNLFW